MDKWEHQYRKYKTKYLKLKASLQNNLEGGAKKKAEKKAPVKSKSDDRVVIKVNCVNVEQKKEDLHFEGRVCKTPPINAKLAEPKLHKLVKMALRFLNKRLRMSDVQKVELVVNGKKKTYKGDALDVDLKGVENVDEINVQMN